MRTVAVALAVVSLFLFSWNADAMTLSGVQKACGSAFHTTPGGAQGCSKQGKGGSMTYTYCDKTGKNCGTIVVGRGKSTSNLPAGVSELGSPERVNR